MWNEIRKYESNYTCQKTGQTDDTAILNTHHIDGKDTLRLRYSRKNTIVITKGVHRFSAHGGRKRENAFREWAMAHNGLTQEKIDEMRHVEDGRTGRGEYFRIRAIYEKLWAEGKLHRWIKPINTDTQKKENA